MRNGGMCIGRIIEFPYIFCGVNKAKPVIEVILIWCKLDDVYIFIFIACDYERILFGTTECTAIGTAHCKTHATTFVAAFVKTFDTSHCKTIVTTYTTTFVTTYTTTFVAAFITTHSKAYTTTFATTIAKTSYNKPRLYTNNCRYNCRYSRRFCHPIQGLRLLWLSSSTPQTII